MIDLDDLNQKVDIFDVLDHLGVNHNGRGIDSQISCPVHKDGQETSPSAKVYYQNNSVYCFTCHRTYRAVNLVIERLNLSLPQAVDYIQSKFKISDVAVIRVLGDRQPSKQQADQFWISLHKVAPAIMEKKNMSFQDQLLEWQKLDRVVYSGTASPAEIIARGNEWLNSLRS